MQTSYIDIPEYKNFLNNIQDRIQQARISASRIINRELTLLYWSIGQKIVTAQKEHGWGDSIVEQLSLDLRKLFPGTTGFSKSNLWIMRKFYHEYSHLKIYTCLISSALKNQSSKPN